MTSRRTFWPRRLDNGGEERRQWRAAAELGFRCFTVFAEQRASEGEGKPGAQGEEVASDLIQARGGSGRSGRRQGGASDRAGRYSAR